MITSLIIVTLYMFSLLPLRVHYAIGRFISWLLRVVFKYRREVIDTNLRGAFPDKDEDQIAAIARDYYRYLGEIIVEFVWAMCRSGKRLRDKGFYTVDPEGEKIFNEAYRNSPSVVTLLSHTGNWELASDLTNYMMQPAFGQEDITVAYQRLHNRISEVLFKLLRRHRLKSRESLIPSHMILRYMLEHRQQKRLYFFIADQYPYEGAPRINEFLGLQTEWHSGAEAIARKLHLPVLYVYLERVKRGGYVMKISQICSDASLVGNGEVTDAYAALLERDIKAHNCNWLWSHRRWKNLWPYNCRKN